MHVRLPLAATVFADTTALGAGDGGVFTSVNRMRPTGSAPDKRVMASFGGWQKALTTPVSGVPRGGFSFRDGSGIVTHLIGTHSQFYGWQDASLLDITPFKSYENSLSGAISTTDASATVRFDWASHGFAVGDRWQVRNTVTVSGSDLVISGGTDLTVTAISGNSFNVTLAAVVSGTVVSGGGAIYAGVYMETGNKYSIAGPGWGDSGWGNGTWGGSDTTNFEARTHTFSKWGPRNVMVQPSRNKLLEWQPIFTTPAELVTGTWSAGTGWTASGAQALVAVSGSASTAALTITLPTQSFNRLEFDATVTSGTFTPFIGTTSVGTSITASGHYTLEFFTVSGDLRFTKDSGFDGAINNISVKQLERLAVVPGAPTENGVMIVTDQNIAMVGGTIDTQTGEYNPMLLRWAATYGSLNITVPANQVWTAASTNTAGEKQLTVGGRITAMMQYRGEVLIWTDKALYGATFSADPRVIYSVRLIAQDCGCISSRSWAMMDGAVYWASTAGSIFMYSGGVPLPVALTVRDDWWDNFQFVQAALVHMSSTTAEGEIQLFYPDKRDAPANEVSRYIGVTRYGESFLGILDWLVRVDAGIAQYPWAISSTGYVYWLEIGQSADNAAIGESFDTGLIAVGNGDTLAQVDRFLPDFKNFVGGFQLYVKSYMWAADQNPTTFGPFNVTPSTPKNDIGFIVGRFLSFHGTGVSVPSQIRFGSPMVNLTDTGMSV